MVFYLEPKIEPLIEYLANRGEYIGTLNCEESEEKLTKEDVSFEKIQENLKQNKFLVVLIFNRTWELCILFNNSDGARELKSKFKECRMIWYWLDGKYMQDCLPHMQYKQFLKMFYS